MSVVPPLSSPSRWLPRRAPRGSRGAPVSWCRRRGRAVAAALVTVCWATSAAFADTADDTARFGQPQVSWLGATTLAEGEQAVIVTAGLPDIEAAWLHGVSTTADAALRLRFQYGRGVRIGGGGATLGGTLRQHVGAAGGWAIALVSEPELALHFLGHDHPPTTTAGGMSLALTPLAGGVTLSRDLFPDLRLVLSVATAVSIFAVPEAVLAVPLHAGIGAEARLDRNLWLITKLDTGLDLYGPGGIPGSAALLRARIGIAFGS